ncbi:MAG TPA: hypothetical protein VMC86_12220 [Gemmatimonadales bacterium]|nr:hypothetical protein [Gemmatimonadales bacterium]
MEPSHSSSAAPDPAGPGVRKPWVAPQLTELPKLTDLTLISGIPGGGGIGGSTVF